MIQTPKHTFYLVSCMHFGAKISLQIILQNSFVLQLKKKMIHEGDVKRKVTAIQHSASGLLQTPCALRSIPTQTTVEMMKSTTNFSQSLQK